jgi:hypothetical protein
VDAKAVLVVHMLHRSTDLAFTAVPNMRLCFLPANNTGMSILSSDVKPMPFVAYLAAADAFTAIPVMALLFAFEFFEYAHISPPLPAPTDAAAADTLISV